MGAAQTNSAKNFSRMLIKKKFQYKAFIIFHAYKLNLQVFLPRTLVVFQKFRQLSAYTNCPKVLCQRAKYETRKTLYF